MTLTITLKKSITICSFLLFGTCLNAQWQQKQLDNSVTIQQLDALNTDTAIICCSKSKVYKTTNGGEIWNNISPEDIPLKSLISCSFIGNTGVIATLDSFILTTKNYGHTWETISRDQLNSAFSNTKNRLVNTSLLQTNAITLLNDSTIISAIKQKDSLNVNHAYLIKSSNFGLSWDTVTSDFAKGKSTIISRISFSDNNGYAVGANGSLLKTSNYGESWITINLDETLLKDTYISDFEILGDDSLLISSTQMGVIRLYNNLTETDQLFDDIIQDIFLVNDTTYLASGSTNKMIRSIDAGKTWVAADNGINSTIFELTQFNQKLWGLSKKGVFYSLNQEELFPVEGGFNINQDENRIEIESNISNSNNLTWQLTGDTTSTKLGTAPLFTLFEKGNYNITLTASNALGDSVISKEISVSTLNYQWETITFPTSETIGKLLTFNNSDGLLISNNLSTLYSNDAGENWNSATFPENIEQTLISNATIFGENTAVASYTGSKSTNGYLLRTTNKGVDWDTVSIQLPQLRDTTFSNFKIYGVKAANDSTGIAIIKYERTADGSLFYNLIKSTDTGISWKQFSDYNLNDGTYTSVINAIYTDSTLNNIVIIGIKKYWIFNEYDKMWSMIDAPEMGSINDITPTKNGLIFATQNGTFNINGEESTKLLDSYSFDAINLSDSFLITGNKEATTMLSSDKGENWVDFGTGITATYYELATYGKWVYALRKGGQSFRTPTWYVENYKGNIENVIQAPLMQTKAYPNPATCSSLVHFNLPNNEDKEVIITDMTGKIVSVQQSENNTITAPSKVGIYLIQLVSDNNKMVVKLLVK